MLKKIMIGVVLVFVSGMVARVGESTKKHLDIAAQDDQGDSALHIAAAEGDLTRVQQLLDEFLTGESIDVRNYRNETPLMLAVSHGQTEVVNLLLKSGASVNARNEEGLTPLHIAAFNGNVDLARILINKGHASVDVSDNNSRTPLHWAVKRGKKDMVIFLLENHAPVDARDARGETALHLAARYGYAAIAQTLITQGHAAINSRDENGSTPLYLAALNGNDNVVEQLLNNHADVDLTDLYNDTPLHAASEGGHTAIARILITRGHANINAVNNYGLTALHIAVFNGRFETVKMLIEEHANIEAKNNDGATPLYLAALRGNVEIVTLLLEHGANLNATDNKGETVLSLVTKYLKNLPDNPQNADLRKRLQQIQKILEEKAKEKRAHDFAQQYVRMAADFIQDHEPIEAWRNEERINKMLDAMGNDIEAAVRTGGSRTNQNILKTIWENHLQNLYPESEHTELYRDLLKSIIALSQALKMQAAAEPKKEPKRRDEDGGSGAAAKKKEIKISTKPSLAETVTIEQRRVLEELGKKRLLEQKKSTDYGKHSIESKPIAA